MNDRFKRLELVELTGLEKVQIIEKIKEFLTAKEKLKEAKKELKDIKERLENIFKNLPAKLKTKYLKEYDKVKKELDILLTAEIKQEGLGVAPAIGIPVALAIVGAIGFANYLNKVQDAKIKSLELMEKILNDPELTSSQKQSLISTVQGKTSEQPKGDFGGIIWIFALVLVLILLLVGVQLWKTLKA